MFSKIARSQNLEGGRSTPPIPPRRPSSSLSVMSSASGLSQVRGSLMSPRLPRSSNLHTPSMSLSSQNSEDHHRDILQREVKTPQSHGILPPPPPPRKRSLVDIYADSLEDLEVHGRKRRSLDVQHDGSSDAEDLPSNQLGLYGGNFSAMSYEEGFDEVDIENEDEAGFANQERGIDSFVIPRLPRPSGQKPVNRQLSYSSQKSDIDEKVTTPSRRQGLLAAVEDSRNQQKISSENGGKKEWERISDDDLVEMGSFVLPGTTSVRRKNFQWKAGRADGQFMVILGHNTVFKLKNDKAINPETGERARGKWRVIRFENRYREKNFPYVEYPARYLPYLIQALQEAMMMHEKEQEEELMTSQDE